MDATASDPITLALVDDHQIVIDGLLSLLRGHKRFRVAFTTTFPEEALAKLDDTSVDVLLTDVMMPGMNGAVLAQKVRERHPGVRILALSMSGEGGVVDEMINRADIAGYVLKNIGQEELVTALKKIAAGGIYFSEEVLRELERTAGLKAETEGAHLTARETEIIRLIEKELSNREIAETLFISERTVETHRKNMLRKTGTASALGLVKWAREHRVI